MWSRGNIFLWFHKMDWLQFWARSIFLDKPNDSCDFSKNTSLALRSKYAVFIKNMIFLIPFWFVIIIYITYKNGRFKQNDRFRVLDFDATFWCGNNCVYCVMNIFNVSSDNFDAHSQFQMWNFHSKRLIFSQKF